MRYVLIIMLVLPTLSGCLGIGREGWSDYVDERIGEKVSILDPTRFGNAGELIRANYLVSGDGFTHITKNNNGDIVQHWFLSEVLPEYYSEDGPFGLPTGRKEWIGKCKIYYVVDPETHIIKSWGDDEGGNPESCRIWP